MNNRKTAYCRDCEKAVTRCKCKQEENKSAFSDGLEGLIIKWEKELKQYGIIIEEEAQKANHDGVRAFSAMRCELKKRLKELRKAV